MNRYLTWGDFVYTEANLKNDFNHVKSDFLGRFIDFGNRISLHKQDAENIGLQLFNKMADDRRTYHSPLHILAIFDFAKLHNIFLELWEENSIWFHDAVYDFTKDNFSNEVKSADFMKSLLEIQHLNSFDLQKSIGGIHETENHLLVNTNPDYYKIMDLDLCSFANPEIYEATARLLREEFASVSDAEFEKGRRSFITLLKSKGFIYRSKFFKDNFEQIAMQNINRTLELN